MDAKTAAIIASTATGILTRKAAGAPRDASGELPRKTTQTAPNRAEKGQTMSQTGRFLGSCDEVNTCECCGKKNLKATVALSVDGADPVYFGVVCAARALKTEAKVVRTESRKADQAKWRADQEARDVAWRVQQAPWFAFLKQHGTGSEVPDQIASLGGYTKARAKYTEVGLLPN